MLIQSSVRIKGISTFANKDEKGLTRLDVDPELIQWIKDTNWPLDRLLLDLRKLLEKVYFQGFLKKGDTKIAKSLSEVMHFLESAQEWRNHIQKND